MKVSCTFSYIQNGILTNKSCSDCTLMSSYDKAMRCWQLSFKDPKIKH